MIENSSLIALREIQQAFSDKAERLGLKDETDVAALVKEIRKEVWDERHVNND